MDVYDISLTIGLLVCTGCIIGLQLLLNTDPNRQIFGIPAPKNLIAVFVVMVGVAGGIAVFFKPEPIKYPSYIAIEPTGTVTKIY